ncbi:MAG: TIGR00730 family Rossman fold protein [Oscillospiraceae bacterium]|nr:TIGR00730 family Rossman fold protein [Oscillospiraceae bacterium]
MKIAVYCGANKGKNPAYHGAASCIGRWIAERGDTLVYGGSSIGMMGVLADAVLQGGGQVIGVVPSFLLEREPPHPHLTQVITVETMSERKRKMASLGEAFLALPGGPGTLEEITEVISWSRIGQNPYPCIFWNTDGYYDPLRQQYQRMVEDGFFTAEDFAKILFTTDLGEMECFIQDYTPPSFRSYT